MSDNSQRVPPAEWARLQEENARTIEAAIDRLEREFLPCFGFVAEMERGFRRANAEEIDFGAVWAGVKDVKQLFEALKPVQRDSRERCWERFNHFRDKAQQAQNAQRDRIRSIQNENHAAIFRALQSIESKYEIGILGSFPLGQRPDLRGFNEDANDVKEMLATLKLSREQRDDLWAWLKKLRGKIHYIREQNHAEWQRRQQQLMLQIEVEINQADEFIQNLYARIGKDQEYIERLKGQISDSESFLDRKRDQRRDLEYKLDGASANYADRVQGWIREADDKIEDVIEQIRSRQDKMSEVQNGITDKYAKIEVVRQQILDKRERIRTIRDKL